MAKRPTIAVVFDFDHTLAPDTTSGFLESIGVNAPRFWSRSVDPLVARGWDPVPAYLYRMIELSRGRITRARLAAWGKAAPLYPGVERLFGSLRARARRLPGKPRLEFYVISCGIGEILRHTAIAREFRDMWACDFHYDKDGGIAFPRRVVSFTDKTRYLFHISKGLVGPGARGRPFDVNLKFAPDKIRIPLDRMVFLGDGCTDIPCFSVVRQGGGEAIGVYDPRERALRRRAWGFLEDRRVSCIGPTDYRRGRPLHRALADAIERIAGRGRKAN